VKFDVKASHGATAEAAGAAPAAKAFLEVQAEQTEGEQHETQHEAGNTEEMEMPDFEAAAAEEDHLESASPSLLEVSRRSFSVESRRYRKPNIFSAQPNSRRHAKEAVRAPYRAIVHQHRATMFQAVWTAFSDLCTNHMPFAYVGYCKLMLKNYRQVATGLYYADRPEQICMNMNVCDDRSYVRKTPHSHYEVEAGDFVEV